MEPQIAQRRNRREAGWCILAAAPCHIDDGYKMSRLLRSAPLLALAAIFAAAPAGASQQGVTAMKNWQVMDLCAKQAQAAFPDFTADATAKREAREKQCLEEKNLPPRQPLVPGR